MHLDCFPSSSTHQGCPQCSDVPCLSTRAKNARTCCALVSAMIWRIRRVPSPAPRLPGRGAVSLPTKNAHRCRLLSSPWSPALAVRTKSAAALWISACRGSLVSCPLLHRYGVQHLQDVTLCPDEGSARRRISALVCIRPRRRRIAIRGTERERGSRTEAGDADERADADERDSPRLRRPRSGGGHSHTARQARARIGPTCGSDVAVVAEEGAAAEERGPAVESSQGRSALPSLLPSGTTCGSAAAALTATSLSVGQYQFGTSSVHLGLGSCL